MFVTLKRLFRGFCILPSFGSIRVVIFPFARLAKGASRDLMGQQGAVTRRQDTHIWLQPDAFLADKSELFWDAIEERCAERCFGSIWSVPLKCLIRANTDSCLFFFFSGKFSPNETLAWLDSPVSQSRGTVLGGWGATILGVCALEKKLNKRS